MESTATGQCTETEYKAAQAAGLMFASPGTNAHDRAIHAFAEAVRAETSITLPPLNEQLTLILGRANFQCIHLAQALRAGGLEIPSRAEHEQAAALHFLLGHYLKHGERWQQEAGASLKTMLEAAQGAAA